MFQVSLRWTECHLAAGSVWATAVVHSAPVRLNCRAVSGGCRDFMSVFRGKARNIWGNQRDKFLLRFLTSGNLESTRAPANKKKKKSERMTDAPSSSGPGVKVKWWQYAGADFFAVRGRGWWMEGRQDVLLLLDVCLFVCHPVQTHY